MEWLDLEFLLELFFEVLMPVLAELCTDLWEVAGDSWPELRLRRAESFPILPILLSGAVASNISCLICPHRIIHGKPPIPGISLALAPLIAGCLMRGVGERLRDRELAPSSLASFAGGALFAFSTALIRFIWIGLM